MHRKEEYEQVASKFAVKKVEKDSTTWVLKKQNLSTVTEMGPLSDRKTINEEQWKPLVEKSLDWRCNSSIHFVDLVDKCNWFWCNHSDCKWLCFLLFVCFDDLTGTEPRRTDCNQDPLRILATDLFGNTGQSQLVQLVEPVF